MHLSHNLQRLSTESFLELPDESALKTTILRLLNQNVFTFSLPLAEGERRPIREDRESPEGPGYVPWYTAANQS